MRALADVATELVQVDEARAQDAAQQSEAIAREIPGFRRRDLRRQALEAAAEGLGAVAPARAEEIARTDYNAWERKYILLTIAEQAVVRDPDRAERIMRELTDGQVFRPEANEVLADIAETHAAHDPDRAERLVGMLGNRVDRAVRSSAFGTTLPSDLRPGIPAALCGSPCVSPPRSNRAR